MTAAAIIALAVLAVSLGTALIVQSLGRVNDTKAHAQQITDERTEHAETQLDLERTRLERDAFKQQRDAETRRANAFEEALADVQANPNGDLDARDVRERVRRAAAKAVAANREGAARPDGGAAVPAPTTEDNTVAAEVQPARSGSLDPNEVLR